jgi:antitoxin ParD1/3/4
MSTMNVSLPAELKAFVDRQVDNGMYGSTSEYVREVLRREQSRAHLRELMLAGASSPVVGVADSEYFKDLHRSASTSR